MTSCGAGVCASLVLRHMSLKLHALSCAVYTTPSTIAVYCMFLCLLRVCVVLLRGRTMEPCGIQSWKLFVLLAFEGKKQMSRYYVATRPRLSSDKYVNACGNHHKYYLGSGGLWWGEGGWKGFNSLYIYISIHKYIYQKPHIPPNSAPCP